MKQIPLRVALLLFPFYIIALNSCISTKNVASSYNSNFPLLGLVGTRINLNKDSSFRYKSWNDF